LAGRFENSKEFSDYIEYRKCLDYLRNKQFLKNDSAARIYLREIDCTQKIVIDECTCTHLKCIKQAFMFLIESLFQLHHYHPEAKHIKIFIQ
jgi:hypothetical protein